MRQRRRSECPVPGSGMESGSCELGRRVAAIIEYDGTDYAGWQSQAHSTSIQDAVQDALSFVAGHRVVAICAGRTDRGVHAIGQVIHFDTQAERTPRAWVLGANTRLAPSIALQWAGEVSMGFHARHKASRRIYRYVILNRSARSALQRARTAWIHRPLDAEAMHAAAQALIGEHDFSAFRSVECQSPTPVRRVDANRGDSCGRLRIAADHRQCLSASHGAQYCRDTARRAAETGSQSCHGQGAGRRRSSLRRGYRARRGLVPVAG